MIFVPLLHYFKCKNSYSGNEYGLRYRPGFHKQFRLQSSY